jgi:hypothetical protein
MSSRTRRTKQDVIDSTSERLGLRSFRTSVGSSVPKDYFVAVADALGLNLIPEEMSMPEMGRAIVEAAGLVWDNQCDSTGTPSGGGSTVTLEGLERIESAVLRRTARAVTTPVDPEVADAVRAASTGGAVKPGQRYLQDSALRTALGHYAEERARALYEAEGWNAEIVGMSQPYDVHCTRNHEAMHVEAKASVGAAAEVLLTYAEVEHARLVYPQTALVVVSEIEVTRTTDGTIRLSGGNLLRISPWLPEGEQLQPIQYRYQVPRETEG